jgi:hypothetical protein
MVQADEERVILTIDLPNGSALPTALRAIASDIDDERDESGYARIEKGRDVHWRISRPGDGVEIDPRQRDAAASLLTAFDMPQEATAWGKSMLEACLVNPGMKLTSMPNRIGGLREARRLIDEMLEEAGDPGTPHHASTTVPDGSSDADGMVLRTYRLTPEEDEAVSRLAYARNTTRDEIVVTALRRMLGETSD